MRMMTKCLMVVMSFLAGPVLGQTVQTVPQVDLQRYVGIWYEIARLPNKFQAQCAGDVTAEYVQRTDGAIDVINRCQKADGSIDQAIGKAKVVDARSNAKLKVRFAPAWLSWLPMVWGDYWVLDLASDYSLAAVGEPGRDYLWVLSRTPAVPEANYQALLGRLQAQGFDTARLVKTRQAP